MSIHTTQQQRARTFCRLHESRGDSILVLPNAWDAMSARLIEESGARAIATTSSGISWSLGRCDGEGLGRDEMVDAVHRIASAVRIPVTADVESGYGAGTPDDVAETVRRIVHAGAVGINLEDAPGRDGDALHTVADQSERIEAARVAAGAEGVELFINARIDTYLRQVGPAERRFEETVRRARAYLAAGAHGIFVPGVADASTIRDLAGAIAAPLNIMARPGAPRIAELRELGVARVSVGPAITLSVMVRVRDAAAELLGDGTYELLRDGIAFPEADGLFSTGT